MRPSTPSLQAVASFALPACFLVGAALSDWLASRRSRDALLARRVAQSLGEWTPPPLSDAARRALERERDDLAREIERLEARLAARTASFA